MRGTHLSRSVIESIEFDAIDDSWHFVVGSRRCLVDRFTQMIDAREKHTNIWYNSYVLHVIQFADFHNCVRPCPHIQQMQYIQNDATQQTDFDAQP